jgi:hypothetical protein
MHTCTPRTSPPQARLLSAARLLFRTLQSVRLRAQVHAHNARPASAPSPFWKASTHARTSSTHARRTLPAVSLLSLLPVPPWTPTQLRRPLTRPAPLPLPGKGMERRARPYAFPQRMRASTCSPCPVPQVVVVLWDDASNAPPRGEEKKTNVRPENARTRVGRAAHRGLSSRCPNACFSENGMLSFLVSFGNSLGGGEGKERVEQTR